MSWMATGGLADPLLAANPLLALIGVKVPGGLQTSVAPSQAQATPAAPTSTT